MAINERLFFMLDELGLTHADLANGTGIKPNTISDWKRKKTNPSADKIFRICDFLGITTDYLLEGIEPKYKSINNHNVLTIDKSNIAEVFEKLKNNHKDRILGRIEAYLEEYEENTFNVESINAVLSINTENIEIDLEHKKDINEECKILKTAKTKYLEYYDLPYSAGTGEILGSDSSTMLEVPINDVTVQANFVARVNGDSMKPAFVSGDIILIKSQPTIDIGELGVFIINSEGYFKEFRGDKLISLNKEYKDIIMNEYDSFYCKGKVLGKL